METKHALKQYYVAVGTPEAKLATLLDLLRALESAAPLSLVICCGARDSLDTVCVATQSSEHARLFCLHSNLSERDADSAVAAFKDASGQAEAADSGDGDGGSPARQQAVRAEEQQPTDPQQQLQLRQCGQTLEVLATTDSGLGLVSKELLPLGPSLLINYDLPTRKDVHLRRITHALGSRSSSGPAPRLVVHFVEAGRIADFRAVEGFAEGRLIEEMPVHVADIFG